MKWTEFNVGFITDEGYVIKGKPGQDLKMKLYHPADMTKPMTMGCDLSHLQLIAEGHRMATAITDFASNMDAEMTHAMRVWDEKRLEDCKDSARDFLEMYPKTTAV